MCCDIENLTTLHCPRGFPSLNILPLKQGTLSREIPTSYKGYVTEINLFLLLGVVNGKCETLRDDEISVFLCEPETF